MRMWQQFDMISLLDTLASLLLAFVLGSLVGLERQYRQRTAGLRTNVLVAVGAALFVNLAQRIYDLHGGSYGVVHVVAYIVSGIGFLGAGVIMRESGNIRGINTAATLWGVAAVGAASGAGFAMEAVLGALFVLAANTLLNVNIPCLPYEALTGMQVTRLGKRHPSEPVVKSQTPYGEPVYWIGRVGGVSDSEQGTDFGAVDSGAVSITPLRADLTNHEQLAGLRDWVQ